MGAAIVTDSRLSNHSELGPALGVDSRRGDAQLLLGAWQRWGLGLFDHIEGSFAFALWDPTEGRLVLARDHLGDRPLHFRADSRGVAFASHPLPLASLDDRRADLERIVSYLAIEHESGPASFIASVSRVEPGQFVIIGPGEVRARAWWTPSLDPLAWSRDDARLAVRAELDRAVRDALDGPVIAAQLSGGLDSSLVVESAARQRQTGQRLVAITATADRRDPADTHRFVDEAAVAADTARGFTGVEHLVTISPAEPPIAALERLFPSTQRPLLNVCNLGWMEATYDAARSVGATTLLTGLSGNFTVSHEGSSRLAGLVAAGQFVRWWHEARAHRASGGARWSGIADMSLNWAIPRPLHRMLDRLRHGPRESVPLGFLRRGHPLVRATLNRTRHTVEDPRFRPGDDAALVLRELRFVDLGLANAGVRARFGLDPVDPTGSRRLIELCLRLPADHYFHDGRPRQLARSLLRGRVPPRVLDERRRGYQGQNWRHGIELGRDSLIAEIDRAGADPDSAALFDLAAIRTHLINWPTEGWDREDQVQRYRRDLIRAIGALRFMRFVREGAS
ncbi:asparagine synthase-related protein [Sphingomonas sp.]|uniref:asparagine synthase-related protein n=1 Tax=Sphingomonas sp. TaxID=28214 RepID=UPI00325FDBD7